MRRVIAGVVIAAVVALGTATATFAQRGGARDGSGPLVDISKTVVVVGDVVGLQAGYGQGTPQLVVREASGAERSFVLGPYRQLQAQGFVAQAGDRVEVSAFVCAACPSGYAVAQVKNLSRGVTLLVRNADGTPSWAGRGNVVRRRLAGAGSGVGMAQGAAAGVAARAGSGPRGHGAMCGGAGPDLARTTSFEGTVKSFSGGPGEGMPTLVLATATGEVTIALAPYHALAAAGYTPAEGDRLEVVAAPVDLGGDEHWVALTAKDVGSGLEIVLRDAETGRPLRGGRHRP